MGSSHQVLLLNGFLHVLSRSFQHNSIVTLIFGETHFRYKPFPKLSEMLLILSYWVHINNFNNLIMPISIWDSSTQGTNLNISVFSLVFIPIFNVLFFFSFFTPYATSLTLIDYLPSVLGASLLLRPFFLTMSLTTLVSLTGFRLLMASPSVV